MTGFENRRARRVALLGALSLCAALPACAGSASEDAATGDAGSSGGVGSATGGSSAADASSGGAASTGGSSSGGAASAGGSSSGGSASSGGGPGTGGSAGADAAGSRASCKRGVAYGFDPASAPADLAALSPGVTWYYGWAPAPSSSVGTAYQTSDVEFVPMIWGGSFDVATVVSQIPDGAKYLLGFNEPNFTSQANLTPEEAAALWPSVEEVARQKNLKIVSPALNYCGGGCNETDPFVWFDKFFAACTGCQVDYLAIHWYACDRPALAWYVGEMRKYGRPMWLTEFSCGDQGVQPVSVQQAYMTDALDFLENDPDVFRYAWFSGRTTAIANVDLLGSGGQLTTLGGDYVSLPATCSP